MTTTARTPGRRINRRRLGTTERELICVDMSLHVLAVEDESSVAGGNLERCWSYRCRLGSAETRRWF